MNSLESEMWQVIDKILSVTVKQLFHKLRHKIRVVDVPRTVTQLGKRFIIFVSRVFFKVFLSFFCQHLNASGFPPTQCAYQLH